METEKKKKKKRKKKKKDNHSWVGLQKNLMKIYKNNVNKYDLIILSI